MPGTPTFLQYEQCQGCVKACRSPILDDGTNVLVGFDDAACAAWARQ